MRLAMNLVMLAMLLVIGGVFLHHRNQQAQADDRESQAASAMAELRQVLEVHFALGEGPKSATGHPLWLQPDWFAGGQAPQNPMAEANQPWLDLAPVTDFASEPPDPVLNNPKQAGFWYSPNVGVVRARVPFQGTDADTLALYNAINGTQLTTLPHGNITDDRTPIAFDPSWQNLTTADASALLQHNSTGLHASSQNTGLDSTGANPSPSSENSRETGGPSAQAPASSPDTESQKPERPTLQSRPTLMDRAS